jgi:hypothetical protein
MLAASVFSIILLDLILRVLYVRPNVSQQFIIIFQKLNQWVHLIKIVVNVRKKIEFVSIYKNNLDNRVNKSLQSILFNKPRK